MCVCGGGGGGTLTPVYVANRLTHGPGGLDTDSSLYDDGGGGDSNDTEYDG